MASRWQRKYEAEAERLVEVLREWYELESETKRLEWELQRCQDPEAAHPAAPSEARKPALLRRAEAGKSVVPEKKRGIEQSWKNRHKEVNTFREHYEVNTSRLALRVERLTKQVADCKALNDHRTDGSGQGSAHPAVSGGSEKKNPYEQMPPALRRMRAQLEKVRQEQKPSTPAAVAPERGTRTVEEKPAAPKEPVPREKPVASEKPVPQARSNAQKPPDAVPAPPKEAHRRDAALAIQEQYQRLKQEHEALQQALQESKGRLEKVTRQLESRETELRASQETVETLTQKQTATQETHEVLHLLARHFRHGQRSFFDQPDAPDIGSELATLIYYSLAQLAIGLAARDRVRTRAMYANLYTIASNLQAYKMTTLHGFDAAFEVLRALPSGDAAEFAGKLRRSPQTPGPEARAIRACLKAMRDKASVELRPFFYDLDVEGEVITIG